MLCDDCLQEGTVTYITQSYKKNGKMKNSIFKEMQIHTSNFHSKVILDRYIQITKSNKPKTNDYQ